MNNLHLFLCGKTVYPIHLVILSTISGKCSVLYRIVRGKLISKFHYNRALSKAYETKNPIFSEQFKYHIKLTVGIINHFLIQMHIILISLVQKVNIKLGFKTKYYYS